MRVGRGRGSGSLHSPSSCEILNPYLVEPFPPYPEISIATGWREGEKGWGLF